MKYLLIAVFSLFYVAGSAQNSIQPPYKRFPTLPPIKILLSDSSSMYTKDQLPQNKPVLFMLFSPECSHCQHETEDLIAHKEQLKDVHIVMITFQPLWEMKDFIEKYKLNELPNVVVGRDIYYTTPSFYNIHNLPYLAMYDSKGNLINVFEGSMPVDRVVETFRENTAK